MLIRIFYRLNLKLCGIIPLGLYSFAHCKELALLLWSRMCVVKKDVKKGKKKSKKPTESGSELSVFKKHTSYRLWCNLQVTPKFSNPPHPSSLALSHWPFALFKREGEGQIPRK